MGKLNQKEGIFPIVFIDKMPDEATSIVKKEVWATFESNYSNVLNILHYANLRLF